MMRTFGQPQLVLTRGEGAYVWDDRGRRYLDLLAGLAVNALGHAHPFVNAAITAQLATLGHISNFFASTPQVALAGRLIELVTRGQGSARVFLTNSGTEANEAAVKITRRPGRRHLVATTTGFHGRSVGALSITGKTSYREPFEPLLPDVTFVPYGDAEALRAGRRRPRPPRSSSSPCRVRPVSCCRRAGYLRAARDITSANGALLWLDEVQTGIGRCGEWFLHHTEDVRPDLVTVAKGLGNGFPRRRLPRPGRRRRPTRTGFARVHVRRQPGGGGRGAGDPHGSSNATTSWPSPRQRRGDGWPDSGSWPIRWWQRCGRPAC